MKLSLRKLLFLFSVLLSLSVNAQVVLEFCPVTKIQASKDWGATVIIRNNTGEVLDLANNDFEMEWPSLVALQWPFSNGVQNGIDWSFKLNLDWPGTIAVGAQTSKTVQGNKFSGVLQFPTGGTYTQNGVTYTVEVSHCNQTSNYELYDATIEFDRNCFISSPTSGLCLGEAATEVWDGEGIFDAAIPTDRSSWAIGTMVAHRLFTNLAGVDMLSPNFWTATALNESRMTCDPTITPDVKNYWGINTQANSGTGVDSRTDNCFQVLNIGYTQIQNNQPDLFSQTNAYGTASFNTVIAGGKYETGALAVTYYHYQDIQYWNQIFCWNANEFHKESVDPYAVEKIFYHAFHDGPNAGISLLNAIDANYSAALAAPNMNTVINAGGTWSSLSGGSSQKVANMTSLLDGGAPYVYPTASNNQTTEYYGCYEENIAWSDVLFYLDKVKILYPQLMDATVQSEIKAVFDGLNGASDVLFSNLGPVIDEIVIQMGGHDPSKYIATQYGASKVCGENPIGISLRTNDTLCPGEQGVLQVWLAGDPNFAVDIQYPDGSVKSFTGITSSPYDIVIDQPGNYEVVYFEDADEVGDINCNFASITVESKNSAIVSWDKTFVDPVQECATGDLVINKDGDDVTVSYTLGGVPQTDVFIAENDVSETVATNVVGGEYILTTINPNACGRPINDTITFCDVVSGCNKPASVSISNTLPLFECQGGDITLSGSFVDGGNTIANTSMAYVWYKQGETPGTYTNTTTTVGDNILSDLAVSDAGTYVLRVQDGTNQTDIACYTEQTVLIQVDAIPTANITTTGAALEYCSGGTGVALESEASGVTGATYTWYEWTGADTTAGGTGVTGQTPTTTFTGTQEYVVVVTNGACKEVSSSVEVVANITPGLDVTDPTPVCSPTPVNITSVWTDDSTSSGTDSYEYSANGTVFTGISNAAAAIVSDSGLYRVILTNGTCADTAAINVVINDTVQGTFTGDATICSSATTSLDIEFIAGQSPFSFDITRNGGADTSIVNLASSTFTRSTSDSGRFAVVNITDANGCGGTIQDEVQVDYHADVAVTDSLVCKKIDASISGDTAYVIVLKVSSGDLSSISSNTSATITGGLDAGNAVTWTSLGGGLFRSNEIHEDGVTDVTVSDMNGCTTIPLDDLQTKCSCPASVDGLSLTVDSICSEGATVLTALYSGGSTDYDVTFTRPGSLVDTTLLSETGTSTIPVSEAGNYGVSVASNGDGGCAVTGSTVTLVHYISPEVSISSTDASYCSGLDSSNITLMASAGVGPWIVTLDSGNEFTKTIPASPSTLSFNVGTASLFTISDIEDGKGCKAQSSALGGDQQIISVNQPVVSIANQACDGIHNVGIDDDQLGIDASSSSTGYTSSWVKLSGQGSIDGTGRLTGLTTEYDSDPVGGTTEVALIIVDDNGVCPADSCELEVRRRSFTDAEAGEDTTICISNASSFERIGNLGLTAVGETWGWSTPLPTGISSQDSALSVTGTLSGGTSYDLEYWIYNPIQDDTTRSTFKLTLEDTVTAAVIAGGPEDTVCTDGYKLVANTLSVGTGTWSILSGTGVLSAGASAEQNDLSGMVSNNVVEVQWEVVGDKCPTSTDVIEITKLGDLTPATIEIQGGIYTTVQDVTNSIVDLCVGTNYTLSSSAATNPETGMWDTERAGGVTLTGLPNSTSQTITPAAGDTTILNWIISNTAITGCSADTGRLTINSIDVPDVTNASITGDSEGCEDTLKSYSVGGVVDGETTGYSWYLPTSGFSITGNSDQMGIDLVYGKVAGGDLRVTASNVCGISDTVRLTLDVNQVPQTSALILGADTVCAEKSSTYTLDGTLSEATGHKWIWNGVDKGTSASYDLDKVEMTGLSGNTTLALEPFNYCGSGLARTKTVFVLSPDIPKVDIALTGSAGVDEKICIDEDSLSVSVSFSNGGTGAIYQYYLNGSMSGSATSSRDFVLAQGSWSDGAIIRVEMTPDDLTGCFTGSGGVTLSNEVSVEGFNIPKPTLSADVLTVCEGTPINLEVGLNAAKGDQVVSWYKDGLVIVGESGVNYTATQSTDRGLYDVEVKNPECTTSVTTTSLSILLYEQPRIAPFSFSDPLIVTIDEGESKDVYQEVTELNLLEDLGLGTVSYTWRSLTQDIVQDQKDLSFTADTETDGSEEVELYITNGASGIYCVDSLSFNLIVSLGLSVPNAFSPNGDGINDVWEIQGMNRYPDAQMTIFNRWGGKLYERFGGYPSSAAWDGEGYPVGTYYYILKLNKAAKPEDEDDVVRGAVTITK